MLAEDLRNDTWITFATPGRDKARRDLGRTSAAEVLREQLRTFALEHGHVVATRSFGLLAFLQNAIHVTAPDHLCHAQQDPVFAAASLAAYLAARGQTGSWSCELTSPRRIRFGRVVTTRARHIAVCSRPGRITIDLDDRRFEILLEKDGWKADGLHRLPGDRRQTVLMAWGADTLPEPVTLDLSCLPDGKAAVRLEEARDLIRACAPEYLGWIDEVVEAVVPLSSVPNRLSLRPSIAAISFDASPIEIAAHLVHEASRQHFFLAKGSLDIDGAPAKLLAAFHARTNVARLLTGLKGTFPEAEARLDEVEEDLFIRREQLAKFCGRSRPWMAAVE